MAMLAISCSARPADVHRQRARAVLPDVPFALLDHEQRVQFMKERVVPVMKPLFQQHDAHEFADFGCKTCHSEDGRFDMPNSELPVLDFSDMAKHEARDVEWMKTIIQPAMAGLLHVPLRSEDRPDGFGCARCHPIGS